ncbi:MAG: beta-class carbonic anhydrase [Candidatus Acidiferrales bacterium]
MESIDEALKSNELYAKNFSLAEMPKPPARKLAIVGCMDARLSFESMLGLKAGDAHVIRNAGGIVTEDALRSLLISHYLLGANEFMIVNHTDCGMLGLKDDEFFAQLERETGKAAASPEQFHGFSNVEENVRRQTKILRSHPWIPKSIPIRGFVYDVKTGRLNEAATE